MSYDNERRSPSASQEKTVLKSSAGVIRQFVARDMRKSPFTRPAATAWKSPRINEACHGKVALVSRADHTIEKEHFRLMRMSVLPCLQRSERPGHMLVG